MARKKPKAYPKTILALLAAKSAVLSRAQTFSAIAMHETAAPLWATAASQEERLAPLLEGLGHELDAAVHRISAASCYRQAGDLARAVNLYRAALAGPLRDDTRSEVSSMLSECLRELMRTSQDARPARKTRRPASKP